MQSPLPPRSSPGGSGRSFETSRVAQGNASQGGLSSCHTEPSLSSKLAHHAGQSKTHRRAVRSRGRSHIAPREAPPTSEGRVVGRMCRFLCGGMRPGLEDATATLHECPRLRPLVTKRRSVASSSSHGQSSSRQPGRLAKRAVGDGSAEAKRAQTRRALLRVDSSERYSGRRFHGHAERRPPRRHDGRHVGVQPAGRDLPARVSSNARRAPAAAR